MKYDLVSDMHIEHNIMWEDSPHYDGIGTYYPWHKEQTSDTLIIAGDCANDPAVTKAMVTEAATVYDHVMFTDGNHEHYIARAKTQRHKTVGVNQASLFEISGTDGIVYLDGFATMNIRGTLFVGVNGWYDWTAYPWASSTQQMAYWKSDSNDSKCIRFDKDGFPDKLARIQAAMLRDHVIAAQTDDTVNEIVVVTHTIPNEKGSVLPNHQFGHLNGSYINMLMGQVWIADTEHKIKTWVFGHTHFHADFVDHGIRFINNARGYYAHSDIQNKYAGLLAVDTNAPTGSAFA